MISTMHTESIKPNPQTQDRLTAQQVFYNNWYLKLNDPTQQRALRLKFTVLSSNNGFKRIAETWAIYFQKNQNKEIKKLAIKQSNDIKTFLASNASNIKIGDCQLSPTKTSGKIQ